MSVKEDALTKIENGMSRWLCVCHVTARVA